MLRILFVLILALQLYPLAAVAQLASASSIYFSSDSDPDLTPDFHLSTAAGQVEPAAYRRRAFTRFTVSGNVSTLGTEAQIATNLSSHLDLRMIGGYLNLTHYFTQSNFDINLNLEMPHAAALVDYYPFHNGFRISPGYLFHNTNRVRADLAAEPGATFTINNVEWTSSITDPVHGTGRLLLGGTGPMIMTGWGHILSRSHRHFTFPIEGGVAFIRSPSASFNLAGEICSPQQTNCQPAATYPEFSSNLAAQVASWNKRVAPFHIYPVIEAGVAYTFRLRE
jgi:hypothetical protein